MLLLLAVKIVLLRRMMMLLLLLVLHIVHSSGIGIVGEIVVHVVVEVVKVLPEACRLRGKHGGGGRRSRRGRL